MRNKVLIGVATLLILLLISVRFIFKNRLAEFEVSIKKNETEQLEYFKIEKEKRIAQFSAEGLLDYFNQYFEESKYIIEKDTVFSFLYLTGIVRFKTGQLKYLDCLYEKCIVEKKNARIQVLIENKEKELESKYGNTFTTWYLKLKDEKLLQTTNKNEDCTGFYPDLYEITFNAIAWKDFEEFMIFYDNEIKTAQIQSKKAEKDYSNNVLSTKNKLKSEILNYFNDQLSNNKSQILSILTENKTYNSKSLGLITYSVTITKFDNQAFQNVADDAFEEQWKYNSLSTGSMPYASCYGSSNYCNDWGCSQIKVITDGSGDVLVSIKNYNGKVVRHAYIKGGYYYTFNVPDGSYQVFFYSGTGWNPYKQMPSSNCSHLKGGFVSSESVTKDNYITLNNQIITYELILQQQGNFSAKPSSINEAF